LKTEKNFAAKKSENVSRKNKNAGRRYEFLWRWRAISL